MYSALWDDYLYWQGQDKKTLKRINQLVNETQRTPFEGIGNPEPLKANVTGVWSRRIDETNRLAYEATAAQINIVSCRYRLLTYSWNAGNQVDCAQPEALGHVDFCERRSQASLP